MAGRKAEWRVSTPHTACAVAPGEQRMKRKMGGQKMSSRNGDRGVEKECKGEREMV